MDKSSRSDKAFDEYAKNKTDQDANWEMFISCAFFWLDTPEGFRFWEKISEAE